MKHLQHTSETSETLETYSCNMRFSPFFFRTTQHRVGERPIPASRRPRMVARPSSGQLRLRLAWPHVSAGACAPAWLLLAGTGRQGREGGRGTDGRWSVAKEKGEHDTASRKRSAPVPRREDEQQCGERNMSGRDCWAVVSEMKNRLYACARAFPYMISNLESGFNIPTCISNWKY